MRKGGFAGKVRGAFKRLNRPEGVTNASLAETLVLVSDQDKRPMYNTLRDMIRSGEIEKLSPGVHRYIGRPDPTEIQRVMWRALRSLRKTGKPATVEDMMELAGASRAYATEFLSSLHRREIVRRVGPPNRPGRYVLVKDLVAFPADTDKADKLRRLRELKKKARTALDVIRENTDIAVAAVAAMEEELEE